MNRLIIIGNGFDLAHGLKTSFNDFITDYYKNAIESFFEDDIYSDKLLSIRYNQNVGSSRVLRLGSSGILPDILKKLENRKPVNITIHSKILQRINSSIHTKNWVDIEMEYFNLLKEEKDVKRGGTIAQLNLQFEELKKYLIEYLKKQELKNKFDPQPLLDCFTQPILAKDFVSRMEDEEPESLYFLNFNYTNTIAPYFYECDKKYDSRINFIHGTLDNMHGNPIFGVGDELDKKFLEFEDLNDNEYYKHIKSFEYYKTTNYFDLLRFIDSNEFQVHIYGHSCGLSDRTMLNEIFEHRHCKSIKIFYHRKDNGTNDFTEKTMEIQRHYKVKGDMRKVLVPFDLCYPMPQPKKVIEYEK